MDAPLEAHIVLPTGQQVPRCQHVGPKGQCGAPALRGELFCRHHLPSAKARPRKEKKEKRGRGAPVLPAPPPRPPDRTTHGLYSEAGRRAIREIAEEILRLEADLDNTDRELAVLKATLVWLLAKAEEYQEKAERLGELLEGLSAVRTDDPQALRALAEDLRLATRLQGELAGWVDRLMESAMRVVNAAKQRAETRAKLAEARAMEQFVRLVEGVRDILWDLLPEELLGVFEERLQREVLEVARVPLPPPPQA